MLVDALEDETRWVRAALGGIDDLMQLARDVAFV